MGRISDEMVIRAMESKLGVAALFEPFQVSYRLGFLQTFRADSNPFPDPGPEPGPERDLWVEGRGDGARARLTCEVMDRVGPDRAREFMWCTRVQPSFLEESGDPRPGS